MAEETLRDTFRKNLFFLLEETFESPARPSGNAYLDRSAGWFPTLDGLTAQQASRGLVAGGTTIAGHVEHARFYVEVMLHYAGGTVERVDWDASWQVREVSDERWRELKEAFADTCKRLDASLAAVETWGDHEIGAAMGALMHSAYHLGAVRQIMRATR